ncbi:MAG: hypothetical protein PUC55_08320 [Lachnospiraceae bacterium]|nr:hypothetical protein [Lachnospiraceae bacterium]
MKSLLDIQVRVKDLEDNIHQISSSVYKLKSDIAALDKIDEVYDFSTIRFLAKQIIFKNHPIAKLKNEKDKCKYIEMLMTIVRLDEDRENQVNRLAFIQWILMKVDCKLSLEDLLKDCYFMDKDTCFQMINKLGEIRECFFVDALIVAFLGSDVKPEIYEYLGDLALILQIDRDNVRMLSLVAKISLSQNSVQLNKGDTIKFLQIAKEYEYYISDDILDNCARKYRKIIVQLPINEIFDFKWEVDRKQKIKKGDVVAKYYKKQGGKSYTTVFVKPKEGGTFYRFQDRGTYYGVLSIESDDINAIKAWVKGK